MKKLCALLSGLVAVLVLGLSGGVALAVPSAQAVFVEVYREGSWSYSYTLYNTSDPTTDAGYDLYDFFLDFDPDPNLTLSNFSAPDRWELITNQPFFVEWFSADPGAPSVGSDIAPGTSLSGFDFTSNIRLASLPFTVMFADPQPGVPPNPESFNGTTTPIPEPATLLLLGIGFAAAGFFWRSKSRKP